MRVALIALGNFRSHAIHLFHDLLSRDGFDVRSYYFKSGSFRATEDELSLVARLIAEFEPDLVGLSLVSTFFKLAVSVTDEVKKQGNVPVIWGGVHPTLCPEKSLEHADAVCVGEGEGAIMECAAALRDGKDISSLRIPNIWVRANGGLVRTELRPLLTDLDSLPYKNYLTPNKFFIEAGRVLDLQKHPDFVEIYETMTSRGCPFACTYCANEALRALYRGKGPYVRRRSVDNAIGELKHARELYPNLQLFMFSDDVFTFDHSWVEEFSTRYKAEIGIPFFCYTHPRMAKEQTLRTLREAGLCYVIMGVQSGSPRVRREVFGRDTSQEQILGAAAMMRRLGILVGIDLIGENSYETEADREETLELILDMPKPLQINLYSLGWFPGTSLTGTALEEGVIRPEDVETESEKGYDLFGGFLNLWRTDDQLRWDTLYYLAKKRLPRRFVHALKKSALFRSHIRKIAKAMRYLPLDNYLYPYPSCYSRFNYYVLRIYEYGRLLNRGQWRFFFKKLKARLLRRENAHL